MRSGIYEMLSRFLQTQHFRDFKKSAFNRFSSLVARICLNGPNNFISSRTNSMRLRLNSSNSSMILKLDDCFLLDRLANGLIQFYLLWKLAHLRISEKINPKLMGNTGGYL
jgi:hypothetical protein